jgi:transcriptional regulator with XRE-family HTH domain
VGVPCGHGQEVDVVRARGTGEAPEYGELGDRLRAARAARDLSLRALADRLGVSPSLISQVERGLARPSVDTLYAMARELEVSFDELLFADARPAAERSPSSGRTVASAAAGAPASAPAWPVAPARAVQRAGDRSTIRLASGVVWERLTAESIPTVDFLHVTYEVGGASSPPDAFQRHGGQEWGYILSGQLGVTIGFEEHVLGPGDAISLDSTLPHRLYNVGDTPVQAIWFVLGRRPTDAGSAPVRKRQGPPTP